MSLPIETDRKGNEIWVSNRELRIRYRIGVSRIKKFFDGIEDGKLMGTECRRCKKRHFPPQSYCEDCGEEEMEWYEIPRNGRLITYTKVFVKPSSFINYPDYIVGIAKMDDGTNIIAWVEGEFKSLRPNQRVRLRIHPEKEPIYTLQVVGEDE